MLGVSSSSSIVGIAKVEDGLIADYVVYHHILLSASRPKIHEGAFICWKLSFDKRLLF
jgi:hypothetical protein